MAPPRANLPRVAHPPPSRRPALRVVGALLDAAGARRGEARLDAEGRVLEIGSPGALGPLGPAERRVEGILLPRPVNGHTHLGDAVWGREPPDLPFEQVVAPPHGLKHQLLGRTGAEEKEAAMRRALRLMEELGTAATLDFREEGVEGVVALRRAGRGLGVDVIALGRPGRPQDRSEVRRVLDVADGLGLSALRDLPPGTAALAAEEVRRAGKLLALHASEAAWEPLGPVLELRPDLLVHLCFAREAELDELAGRGVTVAVCPRSNALYGRVPPLHGLVRRAIPFLLGTDNAMFEPPDLFRELEFAYHTSRQRGTGVDPRSLVEAAFVTPWTFLRRPERARLEAGGTAPALLLRLPPEDPYYQVVARAGHRHLLLPARSGSEGPPAGDHPRGTVRGTGRGRRGVHPGGGKR